MSKIEWTGKTWNPVVGCSLVSPGCTNCYAMKQAARCAAMGLAKYDGLTKDSKAGPVWTGVVRLDEASLDWPLRRRKPLRIFVNSMSDLFHENLPDAAIDKVFAVMGACDGNRSNRRHHTFQLLTKRADRMRAYLTDPETPYRIAAINCRRFVGFTPSKGGIDWSAWKPWPLPNLWLGVSAEDQARFDERWPFLRETPAAVRFISYEPALGPLDIGDARPDWLICGGESGPGARPMEISWARRIVEQCKAAGVSCFVKQLGAKPFMTGREYAASISTPVECHHGYDACPTCDAEPVRLHLNDRKGGTMEEWPEDLRVREFPNQRGQTA
jgi:protein gp37